MKLEIGHEGSGFHFSWGRDQERNTPTKRRSRRPSPRDMTQDLAANEEMLKGLYHGTYPGLQFASPLAFVPITVPCQMMGLPTPYSEDERTQAVLDEITAQMAERITKLHRAKLLIGTAWRWPRFDASTLSLVWEEIPDSTVADILVDIATGRPSAILTDEMIKLSVGENSIINVQRKRRFDAAQVAVRWLGQKPDSVQDFTVRNLSGALPVAFAHDTDEGEIRGWSILSRIIRQMKDYHDIDYRVSETLTRFRPKQVQNVESPSTWLAENGLSDDDALAHFDIADNDFILNRKEESTSYEFLAEGATAGAEKALERKFMMIYEGSGIPEMFWGGLATGNHATAEVQMQQAVTFVEGLRQEDNRPYHDLYQGSLNVLSVARMERYAPFEMRWNRLESISADVKSQIFQRFSQAVGALVNVAGVTPEMLHTLWSLNFPEANPGEFAEFEKGMGAMAVHKAALGMDYGSGLEDFMGKGGSGASK